MDDDATTVARRARAVVLAGYDADGAAVVASALEDPASEVRARAVRAGSRRGRRSVADRVRALEDPSESVRLAACQVEARAPRRSVRVQAALVARLDDAEPLVAVAAADALGELLAASAVAPLCAVATGHPDARCREAAVAALGAIGHPDGLEAVLAALDDRPAVRRRAAVALAAFEGPRVDDALGRAASDRDWQVREVVRALVEGDDAEPSGGGASPPHAGAPPPSRRSALG